MFQIHHPCCPHFHCPVHECKRAQAWMCMQCTGEVLCGWSESLYFLFSESGLSTNTRFSFFQHTHLFGAVDLKAVENCGDIYWNKNIEFSSRKANNVNLFHLYLVRNKNNIRLQLEANAFIDDKQDPVKNKGWHLSFQGFFSTWGQCVMSGGNVAE